MHTRWQGPVDRSAGRSAGRRGRRASAARYAARVEPTCATAASGRSRPGRRAAGRLAGHRVEVVGDRGQLDQRPARRAAGRRSRRSRPRSGTATPELGRGVQRAERHHVVAAEDHGRRVRPVEQGAGRRGTRCRSRTGPCSTSRRAIVRPCSSSSARDSALPLLAGAGVARTEDRADRAGARARRSRRRSSRTPWLGVDGGRVGLDAVRGAVEVDERDAAVPQPERAAPSRRWWWRAATPSSPLAISRSATGPVSEDSVCSTSW